jgi:hypothetical protein
MTVAELSRSRTAPEPSNRPGLLASVGSLLRKVRSGLGKLLSSVFLRVLLIFTIGFAAGMAWQSYGSDARKTVAGWSPHLAWVAPAASPADNARERHRAASLALAAVRQSVDRLENEVDKLQEQNTGDQRSGSRRSQHR